MSEPGFPVDPDVDDARTRLAAVEAELALTREVIERDGSPDVSAVPHLLPSDDIWDDDWEPAEAAGSDHLSDDDWEPAEAAGSDHLSDDGWEPSGAAGSDRLSDDGWDELDEDDAHWRDAQVVMHDLDGEAYDEPLDDPVYDGGEDEAVASRMARWGHESMMGAAMLGFGRGLEKVLKQPEPTEVLFEVDEDTDQPDRPVRLLLVPGHPERSVAHVRRWLLRRRPTQTDPDPDPDT